MPRPLGLALALFAASACTPAQKPRGAADPAPVVPTEDPLDVLITQTPDARWHYDVKVANDGDLLVEAAIAGAKGARLHVDRPAGAYVRGLEIRRGASWASVDGFDVPDCRGGCRLRYRFLLGDAAREIGDTEVADRHDDTILSPPTAWLLRPPDDDTAIAFRVNASPRAFVTGLWPVQGTPNTYAGDSNMFWRAPYSAFGDFHVHRRAIGGAAVEVAIATGGESLDEQMVMGWLDDGIKSITTYFGRFPVPRALLIVLPRRGNRVNGKELGGGGASIVLWVGNETNRAKLRRDWVGVHEMVHLAHPMMPYRFGWLAEGLATYVEPLARAQAGFLSDELVWRDMVRGMPNGQPEAGDRGLDQTRTWGRLYWGGAMFALVADVEIRKRTGGAKSLQHALRATVAAGGHNGAAWSIDRFMKACDDATGTTVMTQQYAAWSHAPVTVDLAALWADLGVAMTDGRIVFDESAPLAELRRQMTRPH